jgi:5S rRNA maturation endonuclease (ribonuclease M5)
MVVCSNFVEYRMLITQPIVVYPYDIINPDEGIGVYSGQPFTVIDGVYPKHYSKFKPPEVVGDSQVYFDGMGWCVGPSLSNIKPEDIRQTVMNKLAELYRLDVRKALYRHCNNDIVEVESFEFQYNLAKQALETKNDSMFRQLIAAETDSVVNQSKRSAIPSMEVEERIRDIIRRYLSYQNEVVLILANYRQMKKKTEVKEMPLVTRDYLHSFMR